MIDELAQDARTLWAWLRKFWIQDVWPVLMTVWLFFVIAMPLIIVILILWYLDSTGWQAGDGFYTIGSATSSQWRTLSG